MEARDRTADRALLERFREGDRTAFTVLYQTHYPAVFRFAFYMTGDRASAAEVTQDAFVWLIHHPAEFDPERGELAAFLGGVARKLLHRQKQQDRRWLPFDQNAVAQFDHSAPGSVPPEIADVEDSADLWKAVSSLPERYREVVVLCDLEERSNDEAAAILGCAVGTVWSRLHRAHELLHRKLQSRPEKQRCSI